MTFIDECFAASDQAKLPSGANRLQLCETIALQAVRCVAKVNVLFEKSAAKFSLEKGLGNGSALLGKLEVVKELGKDGTKALRNLVVGEGEDNTSDLMGESIQELQDRNEMWLRERGNVALIQCVNDCQCLHELLFRRVGDAALNLLPKSVVSVLADVHPSDYASTEIYMRRLNAIVFDAYERCDYPLPEQLGLNSFEAIDPTLSILTHFRRPFLQIQGVWHDMCKILANRIGLGLEDMLARFLKKMVYRLQPDLQKVDELYEEHCKQFYGLLDDCMDLTSETAGHHDVRGRRDREALLINIRDDLIWSFYSNSLIGLTDNMRHVVEIRLVQDLYALITQLLSSILRDRCRFCVSPPQFSGLAKYIRAILQGFEDLFVGRRAEKILSALPLAWVDQHTSLLKEEINMMAIDSTQLIRIANAPPDSIDNKTSFNVTRSQIATGILIARKSDKKAVQFCLDCSTKITKSSEQIEAALLGRIDSKVAKSSNTFVPQAMSKTYKKGWMVKEGQMKRTWKKRWFVLQGQELNYFEDDKEQKQKGVLKMSSDTQVLPMQRPKRAGFSIISQVTAAPHSTLDSSYVSSCRADVWRRGLTTLGLLDFAL
jgi:hypothetical protein